MRLPLIPPSNLDAEQRRLYDDMRKGIEANFKGFTAIDDGGRLIGPWNPWLHFSKFGGPVWELVKSLSTSPKLPRPIRGHTLRMISALHPIATKPTRRIK
jgi:4-carboxymuconolactone decarboxylase